MGRFERDNEERERRQLADFWSQPERWPYDAPERIFVGRAISQMAVPRSEARQTLREHLAYGRVRAAIMKDSGDFLEIPQKAWSAEKSRNWLLSCKALLTDGEGGWWRNPERGCPSCWIYVSRAEFETVRNSTSQPETLTPQLVETPPPGAAIQRSQTTVAAERRLTVALVEMLKADKDMRKQDAAVALQVGVTSRAFGRIWPKAREEAKLPIIAPAGRKRKGKASAEIDAS